MGKPAILLPAVPRPRRAAAAARRPGRRLRRAAAHLGHEPTRARGRARPGGQRPFPVRGSGRRHGRAGVGAHGALGSTGELARLGLRWEDGRSSAARGAVPSEPGAAPLALTATLPAGALRHRGGGGRLGARRRRAVPRPLQRVGGSTSGKALRWAARLGGALAGLRPADRLPLLRSRRFGKFRYALSSATSREDEAAWRSSMACSTRSRSTPCPCSP